MIRRATIPPRVLGLVLGVVAAAITALALAGPSIVRTVDSRPKAVFEFLVFTALLQLFAVEVQGRGRVGVGAIGKLASGFVLGAGPAMGIAVVPVLIGLVLTRARWPLYRYAFDGAMWVVCTGISIEVYRALEGGPVTTFVAAIAAGVVYTLLNHTLLCAAIGWTEGVSPLRIWVERFHWGRYHYLAFGLLAYAAAQGWNAIGLVGLIAFGLPPALLILSFRQYITRTRTAIEEVTAANSALAEANATLEARNEDLRELFEFAGGLATRAADRVELIAYSERALSRLAGTRVTIGDGGGGIPLISAGVRVANVGLENLPSDDRWNRVRDAVLPQLATALESAQLVDRVRRTHLATIAALSRSMAAKDDYTGGHTERVAEIAVALANRLDFRGDELHALEIGALLHDVGKIGISEVVLNKPGPLDEDEWALMKKHPLISEYILSSVDLPTVVRQIARWSHERIDGSGYPDGLAGDAIPLAARIVLVADAWDAITSDRPYRAARLPIEALGEIRANAGTQFCPTVVVALEELYLDAPKLLRGTTLRAVEVA